MDKADPPRTFGVFKPAGHTVLVFPDLKMLEETQWAFQSVFGRDSKW